MPDDLEVAGHKIKRLGDILSEATQSCASQFEPLFAHLFAKTQKSSFEVIAQREQAAPEAAGQATN